MNGTTQFKPFLNDPKLKRLIRPLVAGWSISHFRLLLSHWCIHLLIFPDQFGLNELFKALKRG